MPVPTTRDIDTGWRGFVARFLAIFAGGTAAVALFILLVDPYNVVAFSLPLDRRIVSIAQRHMYPQIVRSHRFDSLIIGSSTTRLLDPETLGKSFNVRFANLSMNAMRAWEQRELIDLFRRTVGQPKVLIVGLDAVWCDPLADQRRTAYGFPEWMYDDNPWNDYLHLFNEATAEIAVRLVGYKLGLYPERVRYDGYQVFTPPESEYDLHHVRLSLWSSRTPEPPPVNVPPVLTPAERSAVALPALPWLDDELAKLPSTQKILVFMPVHVTAQAWPGTHDAAVEAECKARVATIARNRGAKLIDWRISSPLTRDDSNYWDGLHYRLSIAARLADEIAAAALNGKPSSDGSYQVTVP